MVFVMWYPDTSSSSSPALNVSFVQFLCAHHLMSEIFQPFFPFLSPSKIMKTTCWCDWLWCLVSTAHLFAKTLLGFCHREHIYAPFLCADFNLTNASFLRKTKPCCCYPFGFWTSKRERINTENIHDGNATEKPVLTSLWSEIFILERR